jgi:hypothetical protein
LNSASTYSLGVIQKHNFDQPGDQDWIKFSARAGETYTLSTFDLGTSTDTYLYLYKADGSTLLASNDDYAGSLASQVEWTAPAAGKYYALVRHWNPNAGGCGTGYSFAIFTVIDNRIYLPIVMLRYK